MDKCGLDSSKMDAELPQWRKLANTLIKRLDFESEDKLTDDDRCLLTISSCGLQHIRPGMVMGMGVVYSLQRTVKGRNKLACA